MHKILAIAEKELKAYFKTPIAYIILIITISVFNVFFYMIIDQNEEASLKDVFRIMEFMFVFLVPLLTMKLFAEERNNGTLEFLLTTPTSHWDIVLGKYLGSVFFFTVILALTIPYYIVIEIFGQPDRLTVLMGYMGIWLEGLMFLAVGMLASSMTKNQIVAAISSYLILFLIYFSQGFLPYTSGVGAEILKYLSTMTHADNFMVGLVGVSDAVYYVSGIITCLILTQIRIDNRLWS